MIGTSVARAANAALNVLAPADRRERWRPARDRLWTLLERHVEPGARVAVVGAGNADDLPLTRLLARARHVDLIDLDRHALLRALLGQPPHLRPRARAIKHDVTGGAADAIARAAARSRTPKTTTAPIGPLGTGDYDVVIGDLFYTQLLYPALSDRGLRADRIDATTSTYGQQLCGSVVARLHASAPGGVVVHLHDALGWWDGHDQAASLSELLALPPAAALRRIRELDGPWGCDVAAAVDALRADVLDTELWHWPFSDRVDYLVYAVVARLA